MSTPISPPSTPSTRCSSVNLFIGSIAASSASVLTRTSKQAITDPELLLLHQSSRKCYAARRQQYWSTISRWEQTRLLEEEVPIMKTRGEVIDDWVSNLIYICAAAGFEIDDTQSLRDDVFDYVRSVSYK